MLSSQLFHRVFGVYAGLTVASSLIFAVILSTRHQNVVYGQLRSQLQSEGRLFSSLLKDDLNSVAVGEGLNPDLQKRLRRFSPGDDGRLRLLDEDGRVIWSYHPAETGTSPVPTEELRAAGSAGEGFAIRTPAEDTAPILFYARDLETSPRTFLQIGLPLKERQADLAAMKGSIFWTALALGVLGCGITLVVVGRIVRPLERLTEAAAQMSEGEFPAEIHIESRNEIGTLARSLNSMSRQLSARIADLQQQRMEVSGNKERLETVLGAMVEGVIAIDANETILLANSAAIRLLDLKPPGVEGRPLWEVVRVPQIAHLVRQTFTEESVQRVEFSVPRTQAMVAVAASRLPGLPCPGAVLVLHDVTDLRRLENLRREFVANVSHELKTPLTSISAYAETLLEGGLEDPKYNREFVARIQEQAERLHGLILDLLHLARLETSDDQSFDVVPVDVAEIIGESIDEHRAVAEGKQIDLSAPVSSGPILALADADGLRTIIDNLLDNALNYTPDGGSVSVDWRANGDWIDLTITDTGVGIAREHQARIFERFYRVDKARSREIGGTGLGLSIVKHLCQVFGGSVKVSSQIGQGSTFTIRLAAAPASAPAVPGV